MFTVKAHPSRKTPSLNLDLKTGLLLGLLCLSLLLVQSLDLVHNHDGDLQTRFDCDICLKVGSPDDFAISGDFKPVVIISSQTFEASSYSLPYFILPSATARAPPVHV